MNRLLFPNGGMPLYSDDLKYQFDALANACLGIAKGFGITNRCVFWGCTVTLTQPSVSITEGWVLQGDNLFYVPAQIISNVSAIKLADVYLHQNVVLSNPTLMEDGQTENIYQTATGIIEHLPTTFQQYGFTLDVIDNYRLNNLLTSESVGSLTLQNGFIISFGATLELIRVGRLVTINGRLTGTAQQGGGVIAILPIGFRPNQDTYFLCHTGVGTFIEIRLAPNGAVYADGSGSTTISLNFSYLV